MNTPFFRNYALFSKNPVLPRRAQQIQDTVELMAKYNAKNVAFAERLVLDNYLGSIQYYLTGYDLGSIHLSSKALEVALLFKINHPEEGEKNSFLLQPITRCRFKRFHRKRRNNCCSKKRS